MEVEELKTQIYTKYGPSRANLIKDWPIAVIMEKDIPGALDALLTGKIPITGKGYDFQGILWDTYDMPEERVRTELINNAMQIIYGYPMGS